MKTAFHT